MKLILEAIKSLFRKVENKIPKSIADLLGGEKIPGDMVEGMYYTEPNRIEAVMEEQRLTFAQSGEWPFNNGTGAYDHKISDYGYGDNAWTNTDNLGNVYIVVWDGVAYECEYKTNESELCFLGNPAIFKATYDDTGEPFVILTNSWYDSAGLFIGTLDTSVSHTVLIGTGNAGEVHQIPRQYIPDHDHGVVPIVKGGTGGTTNKEVLRNLGMLYKVSGNKNIENTLCAIVNTDFISSRGSIVVLSWETTAPNRQNLSRVQFGNVTIALAVNCDWNISGGQKVAVLCYDGEKFFPLNILSA